MKYILIIGLVSLTACAGAFQVGSGRLAMLGDAKSLRAYGDNQRGLISEAKAKANTVSSGTQFRQFQESEITRRLINGKSLMQRWFGGSSAADATTENTDYQGS